MASRWWPGSTAPPSHEAVRRGLDRAGDMEHRGAEGADADTGDGAGMLRADPRPVLPGGGRLPAPGAGPLRRGRRVPAHRRPAPPGDPGAPVRREDHRRGPGRSSAWRDVPGLPGARRAGGPHRRRPSSASCSSAPPTIWTATPSSGRSSSPGARPRSPRRRADRPHLLLPDDRLQGDAVAPPSCPASTPTWPTSASSRPWPWSTPASPPTPSRAGSWPTPTGCSPTTARSTRWRATATGCGPATPSSSPSCSGRDLATLDPIIRPDGSDSATLDNVAELLVMAGRSLPHALMMLIPEAYEGRDDLPDEVRDFFRYHSCLMEPWDGPASVSFTDGRLIGATLDRNGLRPGRWVVTTDGWVVLASEAGTFPVDPALVQAKGRLRPGPAVRRRPGAGAGLRRREMEAELAARRPYGQWFDDARRQPRRPARRARPGPAGPNPLRTRQLAFGWTAEDVRVLVAPAGHQGQGGRRVDGQRRARWPSSPTGPRRCSATSSSASPRSRTRPSTRSGRASS